MMGKGNLKEVFFRGEHKLVADYFVDKKPQRHEVPLWVGALSFLGRIDEAETQFERWKGKLSARELAACQFYLGVGFCRHSFYEKGRGYFTRNLIHFRKDHKFEILFYLHQGVAFYRYFQCRYKNAAFHSSISLKSATRCDFIYGKVLGSELNGYSLVQQGEISRGLEQLKLSARLAKSLGSGSWQQAMQISVLLFEAQYGLKPASILKEIRELYDKSPSDNTFSRSGLLLELGRQYSLRGRLQDSEEVLNEACRLIYGSRHKRHSAVLSLRYAMNRAMQGKDFEALHLLRIARSELDERTDKQIYISVLGFEERLCERLKISEPQGVAQDNLQFLTRRYGNRIANRIFQRKHGNVEKIKGEDPLGDLQDSLREKPEAAARVIVDSGYYGLLDQVLPKSNHRNVLYVNFVPGKVILRSENLIQVSNQKLTSQMLDCLEILSRGEISKESLVKKLWGYEYHALRHDPLIYRLMGRLRASIPLGQDFILTSETGYRLIQDLDILFPDVTGPSPIKEETKKLEPVSLHRSLNFRQLQILKKLKKQDFLGAKEVREMFGISPMTATRDLTELFSLGLVMKTGDARATRYFLRD